MNLLKNNKINGKDCIVNNIFKNALRHLEFKFYRVKLNTCMNTDSKMFDETPQVYLSVSSWIFYAALYYLRQQALPLKLDLETLYQYL